MKKIFILPILLLFQLLVVEASAQAVPRYLVYFKDKANTPFSTQKPEEFLSQRAILRRQRQSISITPTDFPVNPTYAQAIRQTGAKVLFTSRWFNAALLEATDTQLAAIRSLPFFKGIERDLPLASSTTTGIARLGTEQAKFGTQESVDYGRMLSQLALLGVPDLQDKGFKGQGMLIALLDAGYSRANELAYLKPLFDNKRILDTYDFISRETNVYNDHFHGLNCLSTIAAYLPGQMVGAAYEANFALYRTENEYSETPYEEATWVLAAERADSLGADIISCSLGYSQFDDSRYDYTYQNLDGKTALISRAAKIAARVGILVVVAAGNEGNDPWKYITPPADADSVLAVGATYTNRSYAPFSSIGPTVDGRIKPDVAAVGVGAVIGNNVGTGSVSTGNGTSFATPQIAGLAAILWQSQPHLTAQQLIGVLRKSGHQAANPDNMLGYGVPSVKQAEVIIEQEYPPLALEPTALTHIEVFPNPSQEFIFLRFGMKPILQSTQITVLNTNGTELYKNPTSTEPLVKVPVGYLPTGLYFLKVSTDREVRVVKFIKQ